MTVVKGRSRAERTDEIRRRILEVSIELFLEQGYDKTTTRQITQKAGILNGSLYNIFRGKDDILCAAVMDALWESIRASEKYNPGATLVETIGFPVILMIYVSSRSPRIAELLAIVHKKWEIMDKVCESMTAWIEEKDAGRMLPTDSSDFRIRLYACIGAIGNIIEMLGKEGVENDREAVYVVTEMLMNTFGLPTVDLHNRADAIYDAIDEHDIVICGIRV